MTRELKIALLIGFCLVLVVSVLIADHLSAARSANLAEAPSENVPLVQDPLTAVASEQTPDTTVRPGPLAQEPAPQQPQPSVLAAGDRNLWNIGRTTEPYTMAGPMEVADSVAAPTAPAQGPEGTGNLAAAAPGTPAPTEPYTLVQSRRTPDVTRDEHADLRAVARAAGASIDDGRLQLPAAARMDQVVEPSPKPAEDPRNKPTMSYTVQSGDNLYKIAKKIYGKGENWKALADANQDKISKNGTLKIGAVLRVPFVAGTTLAGVDTKPTVATKDAAKKPEAGAPKRVEPAVTRLAAKPETKPEAKTETKPDAVASASSYTIKAGDSLEKIARKNLGNPKRVDEILAMNKSTLEDPDMIRVGMVIKLPAR